MRISYMYYMRGKHGRYVYIHIYNMEDIYWGGDGGQARLVCIYIGNMYIIYIGGYIYRIYNMCGRNI